MTPHAAEFSSPPASDHRENATDGYLAPAGIIGALLEALNASEGYRLIERDGELFLEPESQGGVGR